MVFFLIIFKSIDLNFFSLINSIIIVEEISIKKTSSYKIFEEFLREKTGYLF